MILEVRLRTAIFGLHGVFLQDYLREGRLSSTFQICSASLLLHYTTFLLVVLDMLDSVICSGQTGAVIYFHHRI